MHLGAFGQLLSQVVLGLARDEDHFHARVGLAHAAYQFGAVEHRHDEDSEPAPAPMLSAFAMFSADTRMHIVWARRPEA